MQQLKTILTAILMLCCTTMSAHDFEVEGIFYYILSEEDRTVEVTYKGSYSGEYSGEYSGNVAIPANVTYEGTTYSVTTIGEYAFSWCYGLTSITIPNSVTTIGEYAFWGCEGLTSIEIPNSVTTIGERAFFKCYGLTSIVVAEDNTIYDSREDCNAIIETATNTLITGCFYTIIPNSITTIGNSAFSDCGLTSIEIPNSVTTIGDYAFYNCNRLTSIEIPNSVTTIGMGAFEYCSNLTGIDIPKSVTNIGHGAFRNCTSITHVTIPNGVTAIGQFAFDCCKNLTHVTLPSTITSIGYDGFANCFNLTTFISLIPADKLFIPDNGGLRDIKNTNCTLYVPYGAKETYAATEGWKDFTNIVELPAEPFALTVSAAKYATLYLNYNAIIPEGVEVYTANTVDGNKLMMQQVTGVLPANTGVIVRAEQGTYAFEQSLENVEEIEGNLLRGSAQDEYITPENGYKYYVLSMKDGVVGMYEDALSGGTFKNNANKAYLALVEKNLGIYDEEVDTENPGMQLSNSYYFDFSGTTAIEPVVTEVEDAFYYDLSGRRVENPTQGIYIVNGKKVLVK